MEVKWLIISVVLWIVLTGVTAVASQETYDESGWKSLAEGALIATVMFIVLYTGCLAC